MYNNYYFLKIFVQDLKKKILGLSIQSIFSQEKDEFILAFSEDIFLKLYLRADFSMPVCLRQFSRAKRNTPDLFPILYQKPVEDIEVIPNDRAILISLNHNIKLLIKFFGNRPNALIFKDHELVDLFNQNLKQDLTAKLENLGQKLDFSEASFLEHQGTMNKLYPTFGRRVLSFLETEKQKTGQSEPNYTQIQNVLALLNQGKVYVGIQDQLPVLSLIPGESLEHQTNSLEASYHYSQLYIREVAFLKKKDEILKSLEKEIQKTKSYYDSVSKRLSDQETAIQNNEIGHIIMANLHQIETGAEEVELFDFYRQTTLKVHLKKELSAQKNAENYYRKAKNKNLEIEKLKENQTTAQKKLEKLQLEFQKIKEGTDFLVFKEKTASASPDTPGLPFKVYEIWGFKILVGRNAKNSDLLITQYSHKNDYWLHAKDTTGSHVIIKNQGIALTQSVIDFAANLAAINSKRQHETLVPISFTQRKYIRKAKGLKEGQVIVEKEKIVYGSPKDAQKS